MTSKLHLCKNSLPILQSSRFIGNRSCPPRAISVLLHKHSNRQHHLCAHTVPSTRTNVVNRISSRHNIYVNRLRTRDLHTALSLNNAGEALLSSSENISKETILNDATPVVTEISLEPSVTEIPVSVVSEVAAPITEIPASEVAAPVTEIAASIASEVAAPVTEIPVPAVTPLASPVTEIPISVTHEVQTPIAPLIPTEVPTAPTNVVEDIFGGGVEPITTAVADGSLASLGLGSWSSSVGWVQNMLEALHVNVGLPWVGSIVVTTIVFRIIVFPLAVKGIINNLKMTAIQPETNRLQTIMKNEATKNPRLSYKARVDLAALFKEHGCNPLKGLITPMVQMPLFVSFFIALRRMVEAPVPSFTDGGILWFPDLTQQDPYCCLPVVSAGLMLLAIESGFSEMGPIAGNFKKFGRVMACMMIPITYNFPAATLSYWVTTNAFTVVQSYALRQESVKKKLGIPEPLPPAPGTVTAPQSIREMFKKQYDEAYQKAEVKHKAKQLQERRRQQILKPQSINDMKLYDYNPTLVDKPHKR